MHLRHGLTASTRADELAHLLKVCTRFTRWTAKFAEGLGSCEDGSAGLCGFAVDHKMLFDQDLQELAGHFVVLEEFYLLQCVGRACQSTQRNPETNTALALEDVFFLVQKCSERAYKTCSLVAALPMGNSVVEILREHVHAPLLAGSHAQAAQAAGETVTSKDAVALMAHVNDAHFACWVTMRLRRQLTENFVANFPDAGEKMLLAMQVELDDIKSELDKMSSACTTAVVELIAPDIVGQVERMLQRANFGAASADAVFAEKAERRGLLSKLAGSSSQEKLSTDTPTKGKAGMGSLDPLPLATRLRRAVEEVVVPMQGSCDRKVLEVLCTALVGKLARQLELIVSGGDTTFSQAGGLCLQAQLRGIIDVFTRGPDAHDPEEGALMTDKTCREVMKRVRAMSLLVSVERAGDAVDLYADLGDGVLSKEEARRVLHARKDLDPGHIDTLFRSEQV